MNIVQALARAGARQFDAYADGTAGLFGSAVSKLPY
jgi:hypothetical protein